MSGLPRPPRAVLFDLDGVLVDTFDAWVAVLDECRRTRGFEPLGPEPIRESWGQGILADCRTFFPGEDPRNLAREYDAGFEEHLTKVRPMPGLAGALGALEQASIPAAVVTNSPSGMTRRLLESVAVGGLPLGSFFEVVAAGDEVARGKPAPDLLLLALERLGLFARGAVMVGDTDNDRLAAAAARIPFLGFRILADEHIDAMNELAPALGLSHK